MVGAGTLALAASTAWLAFRTSREVQIGEEQMRVSRASIEAQERPFVLPEHRDRGRWSSQATLAVAEALPTLPVLFSLVLKNFGKGPALLERIQLTSATGDDVLEDPLDGDVRVIAPDAELKLSAAWLGPSPRVGLELKLRVSYRSVAGGHYTTVSAGAIREGVVQFSDHQQVDLNEVVA